MAAYGIGPDMSDVERLAAAMRAAQDVVQDELRRFVTAEAANLQSEVVDRTPTNRGELRGSIRHEVHMLGALGVEGVVGTSIAYALPVELGSKPHFIGSEGLDALAAWAEQKLGVSGKESKRVAFAVARKISREGTKGHFMFATAFEANEARIVRGFGQCIDRIERRIAGDGAAGL